MATACWIQSVYHRPTSNAVSDILLWEEEVERGRVLVPPVVTVFDFNEESDVQVVDKKAAGLKSGQGHSQHDESDGHHRLGIVQVTQTHQ